MIGLYVVVFLLGLVAGCCLGQWSIYRFYRKETGRDFFPDVFKLGRGEKIGGESNG